MLSIKYLMLLRVGGRIMSGSMQNIFYRVAVIILVELKPDVGFY